MGTQVVAPPPRTPPRRKLGSNWNHAESMFTLLRQPVRYPRDKFGERLKSECLRFVRVVTDDAEIAFGLLLREDEGNQIRVAHVTSVMGDSFEMKRRQEWRIDAVSKERITQIVRLS